MADPVRVFVSHHHSPEEDTFTARLVEDLEAAGADVWMDAVGVGAADFQERINQALDSCQWLVLIMTPAALASPWVRIEVHAAIRLMIQGRMHGIIQMLAQVVEQKQIPPTWGIYAQFDATNDYTTALKLTLRELGLPPMRSEQPIAVEADEIPQRLLDLGFILPVGGGYILPPDCAVPAGEFLMGSNTAEVERDRPQHTVALAAFHIGKYPVTVAEYAYFLRARAQQPTLSYQQSHKLEHPVNVSWEDAIAYARWLAARTKQPWRLPTEAEWEKAARGTDGRRYPWGDTFEPNRVKTTGPGERTNVPTVPVGSYPSGASPYGTQDMVGHVDEWTSSLFKPYPYIANDGREDLTFDGERVLRGGSVNDDRMPSNTFHRSLYYHIGAIPDFESIPYREDPPRGFRLARSIPSS